MNSDDAKVDVLISAYRNEGLERLSEMELPQVPGVRYVVGWQNPPGEKSGEIPASLRRHDVVIRRHESRGVARNRNFTLSHAVADYCLISDDDVSHTAEQLRAVAETFDRNPDTDVALFRLEPAEKEYPDFEFDLNRPPEGYFISECEIAFRRRRIIEAGISFNELFGQNAPVLGAGEGDIFLYQAMHDGMTCRYYPLTAGIHTGGPTTGIRCGTRREVLMAAGAMLWLKHRMTLIPRAWLKACRSSHGNVWRGFMSVLEGAYYCKKYVNRNGRVK